MTTTMAQPIELPYQTETRVFRDQWILFIQDLQEQICGALERLDGGARFVLDEWEREGGGGGRTRVIAGGKGFEKGGGKTLGVWGMGPDAMRGELKIEGDRRVSFGLFFVIHP